MEEKKRLTITQAIRKKCLECSGNSRNEVAKCEINTCPLYYYRLGTENS